MSGRFGWVAALLVIGLGSAVMGAEARLDFRQEQSLKDAVFYLDQAEGIVAAMEKASADWKAGDAAVPINQVNGLLMERDKVVRYLNNAGTRFKVLPGTHSKVAPEIKRYDAVAAALATVQTKLIEIQKGLADVIKKGAGPEYKADFDRLKEINSMYANPDSLRSRPTASLETAKQFAAAKGERERIAAKYAAMLKQPTGEAKQMNEVLAHSDEVFTKYEKALTDFIAGGPGVVEKACDEVAASAKEGVEKNRPGYFGEHGGVTTKLARTEEFLGVLTALAPDAEGTQRARAKLDATRVSVNQMAATFMESIIAAKRPPEDNFREADRDALLKMLEAKWAKEGNGQAILKMGVINAQWTRETKWAWNGSIKAWEKVDKSRVQGFIITKLSDTQAANWPVNFVKDHLAGDAVAAYFLFDVKGEPGVGSRMLLTNVK